MINIYIGKENLPKGVKVIYNPDTVLLAVPIIGTDFQRHIIKEVDKGEYVNSKYFKDRFGVNLYLTCLSTGSKAMLELEAFPDKIICCNEVGDNAFRYVTRLKDCNVYFSKRCRAFDFESTDVPACLNGEYIGAIGAIDGII